MRLEGSGGRPAGKGGGGGGGGGALIGAKGGKDSGGKCIEAEEELNMAVEANESLVYQANHGLVSHSNGSVMRWTSNCGIA
ncbi:unnamed protein product [Sphagnum jensenii]|uniref:Uncharacterized protein n=1 Tax=Sphagnum jensenii TaxID=128206 RepID=A0ABP0VHX3_9BRYO